MVTTLQSDALIVTVIRVMVIQSGGKVFLASSQYYFSLDEKFIGAATVNSICYEQWSVFC